MDPQAFDRLVRGFDQPTVRRRALGLVLATALAPVAAAAKPAARKAMCLANGKRCSQPATASAGQAPDQRKGKRHSPACRKCCSRRGATGPDGKVRCCTPTTCQAGQCGSLADGCAGTLECGGCPSGQTCGGGGTPNVCACVPDQTIIPRDQQAACCGGSCCGETRAGQPVPTGQCMCDTGCG